MILTVVMAAGRKTKEAHKVSEDIKDLPMVEEHGQVGHALELLKAKDGARVLASESKTDLRPFIFKKVKDSLPKKFKHRAYEIARTLIVEANHHDMDPLFLMAVISTESSFNIEAKGRHGEIGLMQLMPETARWIAPHAGIALDKIDLKDPNVNIRLGATYFAQLRKRFDHHGTRYVSAYNMGVTNVRRLVMKNVEPNIYSAKVLGNYTKFYASLEKTATKSALATRSIASVNVK